MSSGVHDDLLFGAMSMARAVNASHERDMERIRSLANSWIIEAAGTVAETKHACADELLALLNELEG